MKELELTGVAELAKALDSLGDKMSVKVLARAARFSATPTKKLLKDKAHFSDRVADSIGVINAKDDKGAILVGPVKHKGGYLGAFFEKAGKKRFTKDGKSTGVMPKYVFAGPSIDQKIPENTKRFSGRLGKIIDKELKKLKK